MALVDNLNAYWKLDESSGNASDSSGNSNTLTNVNSIAYGTGKINNGADLESGSSQYFTAADSASLSITGDLTIAFWFKWETVQFTAFPCKWTGSGNQRSWTFFYDSGELKMQISNDGSASTIDSVSWTPSSATWYHIAAVYDASAGEIKFYVNGLQVGATQTGANTSIYDSTALLTIGQYEVGDGRYADGIFDEIGIWARELSDTEISLLYNDNNGLQYNFTSSPTGTFKANFYAGSGSGYVFQNYGGTGTGQSFATIRAAAGTNGAATTGFSNLLLFHSDNTNGKYRILQRAIFPVDTSLLTSGASVSAATFNVYGGSKSNPNGWDMGAMVFGATPVSYTALQASDYAQVGTTTYSDTTVSYASWGSAYQSFPFNSTGLAGISKTSYTGIGMRNSYDGTNTEPTQVSTNNQDTLNGYFSDTTGSANAPYLSITWTVQSGPANLKTLNGIAKANIKTINGVAIADIKSVNGVE